MLIAKVALPGRVSTYFFRQKKIFFQFLKVQKRRLKTSADASHEIV